MHYNEKDRKLQALYQQVRDIRESESGYDGLESIWRKQQTEHENDWLLSMEIFEILDNAELYPELKSEISKFLNRRAKESKEIKTLIEWGFRLVEYHKSL